MNTTTTDAPEIETLARDLSARTGRPLAECRAGLVVTLAKMAAGLGDAVLVDALHARYGIRFARKAA